MDLAISTNLVERQGLEYDAAGAWAGGVGASAGDVVHAGPLVDEQGLVAVLEPRQVGQPLEVARHRAGGDRED